MTCTCRVPLMIAGTTPCRFTARWWVEVGAGQHPRAMCGTHAKGWPHRWQLLTGDPDSDLAVARDRIPPI